MVKHKLKRLLALALSILLLSSEFSGLIPAAHAEEATPQETVSTGEQLDFRNENNGRPNLFVDFLGDNNNYKTAETEKLNIGAGQLPIPAGYDQSARSNPSGPDNSWTQYKASEIGAQTIFWVGIGIDRKEIFKLLKDGKGLTSFEGGFYYDKEVIEPYYDPRYLPAGADAANPTEEEIRAAYKETIASANIMDYGKYPDYASYPANTQWYDSYEILRAETDLTPTTDLITQEELSSPSIEQILTNQNDGNATSMVRDWRMTYVSLELKDITDPNRRLKDVYDESVMYTEVKNEDGTVSKVLTTPPGAHGTGLEDGEVDIDGSKNDYQYLLLIPFRLKQYGGEQRLHLRLLRNATHFSIGAGEYGASTYGETEDDTYAAWERVTTRNPDRDLKLLTNFTGDLYLFNADPPKATDEEYTALLKIINGGSSENAAKLEVDGDPAVWPVWADADGEQIQHLYSGLGMKLNVHAQIGYTATVKVSYPDGNGNTVTHLFTSDVPREANPDGSYSFPNQQDSNHAFVIPVFGPPPRVITVTVTFRHVTGDEFRVFLSEKPQPGDKEYKTGNETTITTNLDADFDPTADTNTINSFDPAVPHPNSSHAGLSHADGPMGMAKKDEGVKIHVETHADYEAVVQIYNFLQQGFTLSGLTIDAPVHSVNSAPTIDGGASNPHYGEVTLPQGGDITFSMGASDIDVIVTYQKAKRHKATLEVYHQGNIDVLDTNVAQMGYLAYDDENVSSMVYSGIVYEDDTQTPSDHRAVKNPLKGDTRKLPWVSRSAATLSGSLGGDTGRKGKTWNPRDLDTPFDPVAGSGTVMALLASAPDKDTFKSQINGLDLSTTDLKDGGGAVAFTGFRKNLYGDLYSDADIGEFADILWELRLRIDADTSAGGLKDTYHKSVPKSATDSTVAYEYYDLTAAQVQDYLLSVFKNAELDNANQSGYREVRRSYLAARQVYDELMSQTSYQVDLKPIHAPNAPREVTVDANGVREYEDPAYESFYIHSYRLYIAAYQKYVDAAKLYGSATAAEVVQLWQDENLDGHETNIGNTFTPEAVPIHTAAQAAGTVAGQTWKQRVIKPDATPDEEADPKTPAHTIYTRDGRTVWVALEADSAYREVRVELYHQNEDGSIGTHIADLALADGYQNVYSFTMPDEDCVVRVTYGLRATRKLNIIYKGVDGKKDNVSEVKAYQIADPADTKPNLATRTNKDNLNVDPYSPAPIEAVFVGATVTIRVNVDEDYEVELMAVDADGSTRIPINTPAIPAGSALPREGDYTFLVPDMNGDMTLTITYKPKEQPKSWALINAVIPDGVPADAGNTAFWRDGGLYRQLNDVPQGTHLTGEITVAPGYYIRSVTAYGASGEPSNYTHIRNYTYTLTGNGYNGGYGTNQTGTTVPVNIFVDMPGENLVVDVEFGYGLPPVTPENTLTLTVKDDDNEGPDFADNWAKATVYDREVELDDTTTAPVLTLGEVGYTHGALSKRDYATPGQWVKVEFGAHTEMKDGKIDPAKSYYVSKVTVGPSNLGISVVWEDDHTVSFFMPAGSTGVTVEFSKYPENGRLPDYFLTVSETYRDLNATPAGVTQDDYNKNYVTLADSETIRSWNGKNPIPLHPYDMAAGTYNPERVPATTQEGATGVAAAGEEVTMTFIVDEPNWYVQSVVVISDGAAYRGTYKLLDDTGPQKIYTATFLMPTGDAEFIVHYRRGPRPATPDYGFTLSLTDDDNVLTDGKYDENNIVASFVDASGINVAGHADLVVGHNKGTMTDVRHVHAGDTITLTTTLAPGYMLDYMLVNPSRLQLHPVWTSYEIDPNGVVTATSILTMPPEGIAVVARVVKGEPQKYTANLILHPPAGMTSMDGVGQGTFAVNGGTLNNYYKSAVFSTYAVPGTTIPYDLYAFDGYYIDRVTIDPPLGVTGTLSGAFGYQDGSFVMPAANVNVNVWFKKGWPDEVKYRLKLEVFGPAYQATATDNNYANFDQVVHTDAAVSPLIPKPPAVTVWGAPDNKPVYSGQSWLLRDEEGVAFDRDTVYVNIHKIADSYVDSSSIRITDSAGNVISWWYVPGGIAFTMPPRSTTVRINFKQRTTELPKYTATLHLPDIGTGDSATLSTTAANATGDNPATADGHVIRELLAGDALSLEALPGTDRHITAAYAVEEKTGRIIDLTRSDGTQRVHSTFVHAGDTGNFAMPEDNVHVYVRFKEGKVEKDDLPLTLMVSGPMEANPADGHGAVTEVTGATAAEHKTMEVDAPGMDTRFVRAANKVVTTFNPNKDKGYAITKLEVYDADGNPVPYEWISVLQDPPTADLDDPTVWPGTQPDDIADRPGWKQNPELQITFEMPATGVVIHVTYGKVDKTKKYVAQVVVNDEAYSELPTPSRNNAWLRNEAIDSVQRKLQEAHPGDWIDLDVSVHPGYRIEYIKVVPQSFGIVPGLPLGPYYTQNTGFVMPEGNVTVYVKFADDGIEKYNATLRVTGTPVGDNANYGTIVSPCNTPTPPARPTPVYVNGTPQMVQARADMDWVTVNYYRNTANAYIKAVTVKTTSGDDVPFTQLEDPVTGQGTITFPMVNENVTVTVEYDTVPHDAEVYLHVIDATTGTETEIGASAWARLTYAAFADPDSWAMGIVNPARRTDADPWGNTVGPYAAPAGQRVGLTTNAMTGIYLRSAYVIYNGMGQMVDLRVEPTSGSNPRRSFVVHPGRNDVYVVFSRTEPDPKDHTAILMLRAPEDAAGQASIAVGDVYNGSPTDRDRLNEANHGHAQVIARQGDKVIIQVAPAEGYVIDKVLVTPLGFPLKSDAAYSYDLNGNTISFNMPHRDVAITVVLKRGTNQHYKVRLHYVKDTVSAAAPAIQEINYAKLDWMDEGTARWIQADEDPATNDIRPVMEDNIREGTAVTLTGHLGAAPADPDHPDTILSAFVLRTNGALVSLNPPLEGKEAVNGTATDHTASFTMPGADVDVYLVVTTEPPENPWHTAVLVVTDSSPSGVNTGHNKGYLWDKSKRTSEDPNFYAESAVPDPGDPGVRWIAVEEGNMYAVKPKAEPGYAFVPPATLSCNDGAHGGNMYAESVTPYIYSDTMGTCNKAALIHFVSDDALELTVVIRDPENPGNVTNSLLTSQTAASIPDLELESTNVGGAYQIMGGVVAGAPISLTATPAPGFTATAQIHYYDGTVADIPLTKQADGTLTGSVEMPPNNATIIVTFHGDYEGRLTLVDLSQADRTAQATMFEDSGVAPDRITVNHLTNVNAEGWPSDVLTQLPQGTTLTANMIKNDNYANKRVTALLKVNGSTTVMTASRNNAEGVPEYTHTINRADAEIIFVVRDKDDSTYVAAVNTVNKPATDYNGDSVADPTITADPVGAAFGHIWTTADEKDQVTVTFSVPDGYQVVVTSSHANGPAGTFTTGDHTETFTMPAANVQVTITYVRTEFELTLHIVKPSGATETTQVDVLDYAGDPTTLTTHNENAWVCEGENVTMTEATPVSTGLELRSISYAATNGASGFLTVGDSFPMPAADTVVTVRYGEKDPDEEKPFIALVETVHNYAGDPRPGNKATELKNLNSGVVQFPWVEGATDDAIRVAYQVEPGYVAVVTAYRWGDPTALLPVANVASPSNGIATVTMPGGTDVVIRIEYREKTEDPAGDVILRLVGHGAQQSNQANVTSPGYTPALGQLSADGAITSGISIPNTDYVSAGNVDSDVETPKVSTSTMGNELRVYANWATGYQVVRMTVAVRRTDNTETPEVNIPISRYGSAAAGRTLMPYVDEDEAAVIRVYYGNFYTATLHIDPHGTDGLDMNGNRTEADDSRTPTVTSVPGVDSIHRHLDRLEQLTGGETVQTSAVPGTDQRLVGVVWESATNGASNAGLNTETGEYDFTMPTENVDFYAVYKPKDDTSYIAKVQFANGSAHLGSSQNEVTITNQSDPTASKGRYWTAAKENESVVVNVKVAPGYKAEIIETLKDHTPDGTTDYDFYINRTKFVPNLTLGKDATFTMPANTDATVIIRYTKGYDLTLELKDTSKLAAPGNLNAADVDTAESPARTLHAESDGTTTTDSDGPLTGVEANTKITTTVTAATDAQYHVYRRSPFTGTVRVDAPTPATTPGDPPVPAVHPYEYAMPSEDVEESVIFFNEKTPLLAKVEVKGESDINGNTATPIVDLTDTTIPDGGTAAANETTRGTVWTTTTHAVEGDATKIPHTIDMTLTVAKGYIAKIRVRRDDDNYYNNPTDESKWNWLDIGDYDFTEVTETAAGGVVPTPLSGDPDTNEVQIGYKPDLINAPSGFPDDVSGDQHFRFTMAYDTADGVWKATDVTVIVEFVFAGTIPQPFDPDNEEMEKIDLDRGFIYGENRGDFALIDIPTLYQDTNKELFDTDNYDKPTGGAAKDAQKNVRYSFFLYDAAKDEYTPLTLGVDVTLEPEDEETLRNTGDPYNYYDYKTKRANASDILDDKVADNAEKTYVGSRFKLIPTGPDETTGDRTDGAQALYDMLNNQSSLARKADGSLATNGEGKYYTTLYVIAEDAIGQKSAYTQVWIRPHFTVEVKVISYAPNHETTASLYPLMSKEELAVDAGYKNEDGTLTGDPDVSDPGDPDPRNFDHYSGVKDGKSLLSNYTLYKGSVLGANKYYQKVHVMSSELLGGFDKAYDPGRDALFNVAEQAAAEQGRFTYSLTLEKASCLTYTRVDLDLWKGVDLAATDPYPAWYNKDTLTYTISDTVYLITGDVDGDGYTKWQDYDTVYSYVWRNVEWNNTQTEAPGPLATAAEKTAWKNSVYNPESMAYRCDLNGDRVLSYLDVDLVQTVFDYNRSVEDYCWRKRNDDNTLGEPVLPFGFDGSVKNKDVNKNPDYVALFGLEPDDDEPFPVEPDAYWDSLVDPDTTDAPPLDNPWVDEDGTLWDGPVEEEPVEEERGPTTSWEEEKGTVTEVPGGDESGAWSELPVFDMDWRAELPFLLPDEPEDLP